MREWEIGGFYIERSFPDRGGVYYQRNATRQKPRKFSKSRSERDGTKLEPEANEMKSSAEPLLKLRCPDCGGALLWSPATRSHYYDHDVDCPAPMTASECGGKAERVLRVLDSWTATEERG